MTVVDEWHTDVSFNIEKLHKPLFNSISVLVATILSFPCWTLNPCRWFSSFGSLDVIIFFGTKRACWTNTRWNVFFSTSQICFSHDKVNCPVRVLFRVKLYGREPLRRKASGYGNYLQGNIQEDMSNVGNDFAPSRYEQTNSCGFEYKFFFQFNSKVFAVSTFFSYTIHLKDKPKRKFAYERSL